MTKIIEKIISDNKAVEQSFCNYQKERLEHLKEMLERQKNGQDVNIEPIINNFKKIGILDKDGNLSSYYKQED